MKERLESAREQRGAGDGLTRLLHLRDLVKNVDVAEEHRSVVWRGSLCQYRRDALRVRKDHRIHITEEVDAIDLHE